MQTRHIVSPFIFFITSFVCFCAFILLSKSIVLSTSIISFILVRLLLLALIELYQIFRSHSQNKSCHQIGVHFMLGFAYLGYQLCFFGALSALPLIACVAIYLSYSALTPWILRVWMGKRVFGPYILSTLLIGVAFLCSFDSGLKLKNVFLLLAIFAALLKAFYQTGYAKLDVNNSPLCVWLTKYGIAISGGALLMIGLPITITWQKGLLITLLVAVEKTYKHFAKKSERFLNRLTFISLFSLSLFACGGLDWLIYHTYPSPTLFLTSILIYCGIFFTFLQKNLSANAMHDL